VTVRCILKNVVVPRMCPKTTQVVRDPMLRGKYNVVLSGCTGGGGGVLA